MFESLPQIPDYYTLAVSLGVLGQCLRGVLGLVKRLRVAEAFAFMPLFFLFSLVLGGLSGLMGALIYDIAPLTPGTLTRDQLANDRNFILMAISAGYFGADVIEGILARHAPHKPST